MLQKRLLICLCISLPLHASAQLSYSLNDDAPYIARLEKQARETTSDSTRAYLYLRLSLFCKLTNDTAKARSYLEQGIRLGQRYPFLQAASYYFKAHARQARPDISVMETNLLKADSLLQRFPQKEAYRLRGIVWHNYGILQQVKNNEKGAIDAFTRKAAVYAQKSGDFLVSGKVHKAIAIVSMNADQRDKAAGYLEQAINFIEKAAPDNPTRLEELVEAYIIAGENYVYLHTYPPAKKMLDKAKAILDQHPGSNLYLIYYYAEGAYHDNLQQYPQAIDSYTKGITLATHLGAPLPLHRLQFAKYETLFNQKDYKNAALVLKDLLQNPSLFTNDKKNYYKAMYTTYVHLGSTREALQWAERYIALSDSLYENKFQKDIIELETRYKNAENQKKIATLQADKEKAALESKNTRLLNGLLGAISMFLFAGVCFSYLFYRSNKKLSLQKEVNYQQQLKETEQKQQMQLTKALMQGEEKERKRLAGDLHDGLGGMLAGVKIHLSRLVTDSSRDTNHAELHKLINQMDVSVDELRRIAHNLMPESLLQLGLETALKEMCESLSTDATHIRFQALHISQNLPKETQLTIYRIIQELLANAIRHAHASEILVQCSQNDNVFFITLEDNGRGFDTLTLPAQNGIGLTNVKNRVDYLKGKLDVSSVLNEGTTINIELYVNA